MSRSIQSKSADSCNRWCQDKIRTCCASKENLHTRHSDIFEQKYYPDYLCCFRGKRCQWQVTTGKSIITVRVIIDTVASCSRIQKSWGVELNNGLLQDDDKNVFHCTCTCCMPNTIQTDSLKMTNKLFSLLAVCIIRTRISSRGSHGKPMTNANEYHNIIKATRQIWNSENK